MITDVEVYLENSCWYVKYTQDGEVKISNAFMEESHATRYISILESGSL